jgi:hypothetical protein
MSRIAAALFPLTFLSVTHSISALVVTTGLLGLPEIAAEIVIVQGAVIAAFHAFSGNARNLILRENGAEAARRIAGARVLLLPALLLVAFALGVFNAAAGLLLAALLVVRRAAEWLAEVYLCVLEIRGARRASAVFSARRACFSSPRPLARHGLSPVAVGPGGRRCSRLVPGADRAHRIRGIRGSCRSWRPISRRRSSSASRFTRSAW